MGRRIAIAVSVIFLITGFSIYLISDQMASRPVWELSAHNSAHGVIVEIFKENQSVPTYFLQLEGRSIDGDVDRVTRQELPSHVGTTTFHDDTLKPGRWTIEIDGVEVDIMERVAIVDGDEKIAPRK